MARPRPAVTLDQIAREAGFSRSTVGHVLSGRGDEQRISESTQQQILAVARRLNYRPSPLARGLRGLRTGSVGVIWSLGGPQANEEMVRRIARHLLSMDLVPYVFDNTGPDAAALALSELRQRGADGVVMELEQIDDLNDPRVAESLASFRARLLVVPEPVAAEADVIVLDRGVGLTEAANHLLGQGRRRLGYVMNLDMQINRPKRAALRRAVEAFGQGATLKEWIVNAVPPRQVLAFCQQHPELADCDALLFTTDHAAMACLRWLESIGRRCPQEVAVVGFNDDPACEVSLPALASVQRAAAPLTERIGALLAARLQDPASASMTETVSTGFVWRTSAG